MTTIWHMFAISFVAKASYTDRLFKHRTKQDWALENGQWNRLLWSNGVTCSATSSPM